MLRSSEDETEILLGNKHLLGIFFVIAILLGVAFTGGYMVGRSTGGKQTVAGPLARDTTPAVNTATTGGETHAIVPDTTAAPDQSSTSTPEPGASSDTQSEDIPLGSPRHKAAPKAETQEASAPAPSAEFVPHSGEQFLQVTAVQREEAEAVADVLHKKGFRAHAVPKPGSTTIYRVLIGPIRDAGDLSSTRDALRRTGFREIIVQRY